MRFSFGTRGRGGLRVLRFLDVGCDTCENDRLKSIQVLGTPAPLGDRTPQSAEDRIGIPHGAHQRLHLGVSGVGTEQRTRTLAIACPSQSARLLSGDLVDGGIAPPTPLLYFDHWTASRREIRRRAIAISRAGRSGVS